MKPRSAKGRGGGDKKNSLKEVMKGVWGMPWLSEAKKDVISCDKLRGGANILRSADFRMGKPLALKAPNRKRQTRGTETSKYPEEKKTS